MVLDVTAEAFSADLGEVREVGELLAEGMRVLRIGPSAIARATGMPRPHVYQITRGHRPLQVRHLLALPEELRDFMLRGLLRRVGRTLADRLPADVRGLRDAATDASAAALELTELLRRLRGKSYATADLAEPVIQIGERLVQAGASIVEWGRRLQRERVVGLDDEEGR